MARSKASIPLSVTALVPLIEPTVPPLPICKVPPAIAVQPLKVLLPLRMTVPPPPTVRFVPVLLSLIGPEKVRLPAKALTAKLLPKTIGTATV